jgi:hypothetical protein
VSNTPKPNTPKPTLSATASTGFSSTASGVRPSATQPVQGAAGRNVVVLAGVVAAMFFAI